MVWYLEQQVEGQTSQAQESRRNNYGSKSYEILMGRWPIFSIKILQWQVFRLGVLSKTSTLPGYKETNIMVLGKTFQPSYLPEIQIWPVSGYSRLIKSRKRNESLQHKSTRWRCEILGGWTTIASSKTWAGSATTCEHIVPEKHYHMVVLQ